MAQNTTKTNHCITKQFAIKPFIVTLSVIVWFAKSSLWIAQWK